MPKKVDHDARRRELAQIVLELVGREGFESVTIRSVAAEAGWTRGVVAHYFRSRDELILHAYREALRRLFDSIPTTSALGDPVDRLVAALCRLLPSSDELSRDHSMWLGMLARMANDRSLAAAVAAEAEGYSDYVRAVFAECVAAGRLAPPLPEARAFELLSIFVEGLGNWSVVRPRPAEGELLQERVSEFLSMWEPSSSHGHD